MRILIAISVGFVLGFLAVPAFAAGQADLVSKKANSERSKFEAAPVKDCFQSELDLFESTRGRVPNNDEADLIIDACMKLGHS